MGEIDKQPGQVDLEEYISGSEKPGRGRGRPKSEPTQVASAMLSKQYLIIDDVPLKNAEIVAKVEHWLDNIDVDKLIEEATEHTLASFKETGQYRPIDLKFQMWYADEARKSIRLKRSLFNRVDDMAEKLGVRKSDIFNMSLAGSYLEYCIFETPDFRHRRNSMKGREITRKAKERSLAEAEAMQPTTEEEQRRKDYIITESKAWLEKYPRK